MDIQHDLTIKASAEKIYQAVSTEEGISGWWAKRCLVGTGVGEKSLLKFNKEGMIVDMGFKTEKLSPNTNVIWECTENANPAWIGTKVETEISEEDGVCKVVFKHTGFDEKWKGQEAFEMTKGGWMHFTNSLVSYCESGAGQAW